MTLQEFWDLCENHDWYFAMSDDHGVWRRGQANIDRLSAIAKASGQEYVDMLEGFSKHMFSGKPWNTEKTPKPERPV
jgi:hypothetical protein